jgi:hypothetical protein
MEKARNAIIALLLFNLLLLATPEVTAYNASLTYAPNVF